MNQHSPDTTTPEGDTAMRATLVKVTIGLVLLGFTMILAAAVGHKATLEQRAYTPISSTPVVVASDRSWEPGSVEMDPEVAKVRKQMDQQEASSPQEDEAGWNCARHGNRICGPGNSDGAVAGCYRDGALVTPWTRYDDPRQDPLWVQEKSPC